MTSFRVAALRMLWCLALGCERDQPPGDLENRAGQAGEDAGTSRHGGTGGSASGGATTGGAVNGGSANGGSNGGDSSTAGSTSGSSANAGSANAGSANGGSANGGSANGGGPGGNCFSPDNKPELALEPSAAGCDCAAEEVDQCIMVPDAEYPHLVGMGCRGGRWSTIEDGPCEYGQTHPWGCMIENRVFRQAGPVPEEFLCRLCSWCGDIVNDAACPLLLCAPPTCPTGTVQGSRCRSCGMGPGGCDIVEHGCLPTCESDEECEFGSCSQKEGFCSIGSICI